MSGSRRSAASPRAAVDLRQLVSEAVVVGQDAVRPEHHALALAREALEALPAPDERHAELGLELAQPRREGRLRDVERSGAHRNVARARARRGTRAGAETRAQPSRVLPRGQELRTIRASLCQSVQEAIDVAVAIEMALRVRRSSIRRRDELIGSRRPPPDGAVFHWVAATPDGIRSSSLGDPRSVQRFAEEHHAQHAEGGDRGAARDDDARGAQPPRPRLTP